MLRNRPNFQVHRATFANKQIIVILTEMCFLPQLPVSQVGGGRTPAFKNREWDRRGRKGG
jgi:hypothetical protein